MERPSIPRGSFQYPFLYILFYTICFIQQHLSAVAEKILYFLLADIVADCQHFRLDLAVSERYPYDIAGLYFGAGSGNFAVERDPAVIAGFIRNSSAFDEPCDLQILVQSHILSAFSFLQHASKRRSGLYFETARCLAAAGCIIYITITVFSR